MSESATAQKPDEFVKKPIEESDYESDHSNHSLKIVLGSPKAKSKQRQIDISPADKSYIDAIEEELDKLLDEKAAKSNLTVQNVKNLLRHIVSNEHLLALCKRAEDPNSSCDELSQFGPKLTRAKTKELYSTQAGPWISSNIATSETQVLISEDLPEDDSEEEYVPNTLAEDESEDDRDTSVISESDPATPYSIDTSTQTSDCFPSMNQDTTLVQDGGGTFKVPPPSSTPLKQLQREDEANIALRTRSKLCLTATPLELIEEAFIPPDITTDMYDMDCGDDVEWTDFLREFTRPLDEVVRPRDDEEHDPEYNVMEDDSINKIDKEELRADKGVEVSKKELSELIAELFDYTDNFDDDNNVPDAEPIETIQLVIPENPSIQRDIPTVPPLIEVSKQEERLPIFELPQLLLLQQQIRQHVQLLTQSFVLTYLHPEHEEFASTCAEYLDNIKYLPVNFETSVYNVCNINPAIAFVDTWKKLLQNTSSVQVRSHFEHVARVLNEVQLNKSMGRQYVPTFSKLVLENVSKSDLFLYPYLLPRIPCLPRSAIRKFVSYIRSEEELIAMGLDQFIPYLAEDERNLHKKEIKLSVVCHYIQRYMLPPKQAKKIQRHIGECRRNEDENNAISHYYKTKKAPNMVHYLVSLEDLGILPPCRRPLEQLPELWKQYVSSLQFENAANTSTRIQIASITPLRRVIKPPLYNTVLGKRLIPAKYPKRRCSSANVSHSHNYTDSSVVCDEVATSTPKFGVVSPKKSSRKSLLYRKTPLNCASKQKFVLIPTDDTMSSSVLLCNNSTMQSSTEETSKYIEILQQPADVIEILDTVCKDTTEQQTASVISNCTAKSSGKKSRISLVEKRKQKFRKEFNANLNMLLPEDQSVIEEKTNMFVQSFYDKVHDQLDLPDYHKFMEILNDFDEEKNTAQELYKNVVAILEKKYPDVADEFLTFLTTAQAKSLGKLVPHFMLGNMSFFLRRLEMYFKEQPSQVKKIYHSLAELSERKNITMDQVKASILPLLKGNTLIIDWFLQFFPDEKPSQKLLNGPWESVELGKDTAVNANGEDIFETITVPEVEDPYGGSSCICTCHETDNTDFKSRLKHCVPCGTKFLQGRVFIQTGKGLRVAKISFSDDDTTDNYSRLACKTTAIKRRSDSSPSKQISPNKDHNDEGRVSNDSEEDLTYSKKKHTKSPRKRRLKVDTNSKVSATPSTNVNVQETSRTINMSIESCVDPSIENSKFEESGLKNKILFDAALAKDTQLGDDSVVISGVVQEPINCIPFENNANDSIQKMEERDCNVEWDCNTSIESMELRVSPEHDPEPSAESENEFCEETSQDNLNSEDTEDSAEEMEIESNSSSSPVPSDNSNTYEDFSWTREEDKVILQTVQAEGGTEDAFRAISHLLDNRSIPQVKQRFNTLLTLIRKMTNATS